MITKRVIEVGMDIEDPVGFLADVENNLLGRLRAVYEGICFAGCYIRRVLAVVERSPCDVLQNGSNVGGRMRVRFEAEVQTVLTDEILTGCKVISKERGGMSVICALPNADIYVDHDEAMLALKEGHLIPVRVAAVAYPIGQRKMAITARFFSTQVPRMLFHVTKPATIEATAAGERLATALATAADIQKNNPKGWESFRTLLGAWKVSQTPPTVGAQQLKLQDVLSSGHLAPGYYIQDDRLNLADGIILYYSKAPAADAYAKDIEEGRVFPVDLLVEDGAQENAVQANATQAIGSMVQNYVAQVETISSMLGQYSTEQALVDHKGVWAMIRRSQRT